MLLNPSQHVQNVSVFTGFLARFITFSKRVSACYWAIQAISRSIAATLEAWHGVRLVEFDYIAGRGSGR